MSMGTRFNVNEWLSRCKNCRHSKLVTSVGIACKLKGTCSFEAHKEIKPEEQKSNRGAKKKVRTPNPNGIECHRCHEHYAVEDMHGEKFNGKIYYRVCKNCRSEINTKYRAKKKLANKKVLETFEGLGRCPICGEEKEIRDLIFRAKNDGSIKFELCRDCKNIKNREEYRKRKAGKNGKVN